MPTDETVRNIEAIIRSKAKIKGDAHYIPRPCAARVVSDDDEEEEDGVKSEDDDDRFCLRKTFTGTRRGSRSEFFY